MHPISYMQLDTVEISAAAHPNEMKLRGTLLRLDEPSTKAPHGSHGHRILVPSALAKKRVATLVNMGLNYAPSLQEHAQRRKVGVITKAWIDGRDLKVEATVWKRDFPEAERDLKQSGLGMSMEIGDFQVEDQNAAVWVLSDFCFLGATVLEKTSAAYFKTHAIAAARQKERTAMAEKKKVRTITTTAADLRELVASSSADLAEAAVKRIMKPFARTQAEILTRLDAIDAASKEKEDDEEDDEDASGCDPTKMKGAKKKSAADDDEDDSDDDDEDDDEDDMESEIDTGDEEEMGPEEDVEEDKPGQMNKEAKNKGRKTTSEDKVGKTVSSARLKASLAREQAANVALNAATRQLKAMRKELRQVKELAATASEQMGRRSVVFPGEVTSLLRKGGIDVKELQASGEKLTVEQVDALLANVGGLPPVKRMELKGLLAHNGLMEEGRVTR